MTGHVYLTFLHAFFYEFDIQIVTIELGII